MATQSAGVEDTAKEISKKNIGRAILLLLTFMIKCDRREMNKRTSCYIPMSQDFQSLKIKWSHSQPLQHFQIYKCLKDKDDQIRGMVLNPFVKTSEIFKLVTQRPF